MESERHPAALDPYLEAVRAENPDGKLRFYPGSPLIAKRFLRASDRMVLTELNKVDFDELQTVFAGQRRVAVQFMDAYQALKAYLPPAERRGLVLIDSSFDRARELDRIVKALKDAYGRWATGHVCGLVSADGARADARFLPARRALRACAKC